MKCRYCGQEKKILLSIIGLYHICDNCFILTTIPFNPFLNNSKQNIKERIRNENKDR